SIEGQTSTRHKQREAPCIRHPETLRSLRVHKVLPAAPPAVERSCRARASRASEFASLPWVPALEKEATSHQPRAERNASRIGSSGEIRIVRLSSPVGAPLTDSSGSSLLPERD